MTTCLRSGAPIDGVVVEKNINPGQEVRPDAQLANDPKLIAPLFVISNPENLTVTLDVTELDISELKSGQTMLIRSRAFPDRVFNGQLRFLGDSLDPQTRTVKARGSVNNPDGLLKAEMYVDVDVETGGGKNDSNTSAVEIPVSAVFTKENKRFVFVENHRGEFERKAVTLGTEHDGRIVVTDGLAVGQSVVTEGCLQLQSLTEGGKEN